MSSTESEVNARESTVTISSAMKSLRCGQPQLAMQQAQIILQNQPDDIDALFVVAAAHRALGNHKQALRRLQALLVLVPDFALAQQELGFVYGQTGQILEGIQALQRAVAINPRLQPSWQMMGELFLADGDEVSANEAFKRHLMLSSHDPELIRAINCFNTANVGQAEQLCRDYLKQNPENVTAIRLLAEIGMKVGALSDAQYLLERCLELAPDFEPARLSYAQVLNKSEQLEAALEQVDLLLKAQPGKPALLILRASVLVKIGDYKQAIGCYDYLLTHYPPQAKTALSYAHALKTCGDTDAAIAAYRQAITLQPGFGDAYWSLANLKTFRFDDNDIDAMRTQINQQMCTQEDYFHLCFALGKALEQRQRYDESFLFYQKGNAIKEKQEAYDADNTHSIVTKIKSVCSLQLFSNSAGTGCQAPDPIFIVGLPRSGSTLLEQILASHSMVDGTKELGHILAMVRHLGGKKKKWDVSRYPDILTTLTDAQCTKLGQQYIDQTAIQRAGAPFFIDKMPNNFLHIGLINKILPNARIIDARRHPMAACFSGYTQLFAKGQEFTYSLADIGRYYRDYVDIMDHWDQVLPGKVLRVQYEDVVADTQTQVRRILDYCKLPFEPACLEFYKTRRPVRTASSEQVRQPIYNSGLDHWRHYEKHLDELKQNLGAVLERYPID